MPNSEGSLTSIKDPKQRYTKAQCIGRGASKVVYKAFDEVEGLEVAWNEVLCSDACLGSGKERSRMLGEITMLRQLKHKNIMRLYDWWYDKQQQVLVFITELLTDGSLRRYIRRKHAQGITLSVLKRYAWQILQGLVYLHGHYPPIIHRDLKCDNIFVNGASGELKIGDLGFATLLRGMSAPLSVIGTPEFMAPELYDEHYDEKVDIYSYGMCLLELATLEYPYSECTNPAQIYRKVSRGIPPASLAKVTDPQLKDFILLTINPDPSRRPEARQLLCHPFFEDLRQHIRAKGWLKGPAPALGAAAAAADPVRHAAAAAAVVGTAPGASGAVRVPMSAPDGLAAIVAALHAAEGDASQDKARAVPPAAVAATGSDTSLLPRQQQQHLMQLLQQDQQEQQQEQPVAGVVDTRPPAAAITDALLEIDSISSSDTAVKQKPQAAAYQAVSGPDIRQQPDQLQQQQQQQRLSSNTDLVCTPEQQQRHQQVLHLPNGPSYHPSTSSSVMPATITPARTDSNGSVLAQTPVASPFADASWASCSSVHSWGGRTPSTGAAAASSKEVTGAASAPATPVAAAAAAAAVTSAVDELSPLRAGVRHHAATKGRHSLDELSEDDVLFEADSQNRTDDVDSEHDELHAAASSSMSDVWQHMQHSTAQQQQQQQHMVSPMAAASAAAACGPHHYLDTIHEHDVDDDDEGEVDCVCRRIDNQQLSFNVGFFNRGMRKRVGFQYNADEDTVDDIAVEMLENLSLMPQQAEAIARKIRAALEALGMSQGPRRINGSTPCSIGPCSIGTVTAAAAASKPSAPADSGSTHMTGKNAAIAIVATAAASAAIESCSTPQQGSVDAPSSILGSSAAAAGSGRSSAAGSYTSAAAEGLAGQFHPGLVPSPAGTPQSAGHTPIMSRLGPNHGLAVTSDGHTSFSVSGSAEPGVGIVSSVCTAASVHACTEQLVRELSMLNRDQGQALLQTLQEDLLIQSIAMPEAAAAVGVELGVPLTSPHDSPAAGLLAVAAEEQGE